MHRLSLTQANALIEAAFAKGAALGLKPLTVTVHDPGGHLIACQRQDGASNMRVKLAGGKASGKAHVYWTFEDGTTVKEEDKPVSGDVVSFEMSQASGMKPGQYNVQIDIDGVPVGITDFVVR